MEHELEDAARTREEGRRKLVRRVRSEEKWGGLYIHTRTKINYYKPLPFAYSHQFILLRWIPIPDPIPIYREPRARNKGFILSNLCMSNQSPSLLLSSPLALRFLFERSSPRCSVRLGRVLDRCRRRTWGQETRSKRETGGGGPSHPDNEGGPRYPVQIFSSTCVCTGAASIRARVREFRRVEFEL